MKRLVILGAGGHGQTVADVAEQTGLFSEIIFLDDNSELASGKCSEYKNYIDDNTVMYPAFGNNEARLNWEEEFLNNEVKLAKIIHPTAYISPKAEVADGCVVFPNAIINTDTKIERACIINCGAIVDHGCVVEAGVHIGLGAIVKAENRVPKCTKLDAGEVIKLREYLL